MAQHQQRQSSIGEIFSFLAARKKWWLSVVMLFALLMSLVVVLTANTPVAPFIYTLF